MNALGVLLYSSELFGRNGSLQLITIWCHVCNFLLIWIKFENEWKTIHQNFQLVLIQIIIWEIHLQKHLLLFQKLAVLHQVVVRSGQFLHPEKIRCRIHCHVTYISIDHNYCHPPTRRLTSVQFAYEHDALGVSLPGLGHHIQPRVPLDGEFLQRRYVRELEGERLQLVILQLNSHTQTHRNTHTY